MYLPRIVRGWMLIGGLLLIGPSWLRPADVRGENCGCTPCDFDQDGDVDLDDFGHLQLCLTGFAIPQNDPACQDTKLDTDGDVDSTDVAIFVACLAGADRSYSGSPLPPVVISEFMAINGASLADEDGDASDWIELYNPCRPAVDISGWHLTDDPADPLKWSFPVGVVIPRGGFLIVFASDKDRRNPAAPLHTNFNLEKNGEYLALTGPEGTIVHAYAPTFPPQSPDVSYGLAQSGGTTLTPRYFSPSSPRVINGAGAAGIVEGVALSPQHGFYNAAFQLTMSTPTPGAVIRYTLDGNVPTATTGAAYTGSITIGKTSIVRAVAFKSDHLASRAMTGTYVFAQDVVLQSPQGQTPGPTWPTGTVNGQVFQYGMDPDIVNNAAWKDLIVPAMTSIPTFSLVCTPVDLFDPATGLYTHSEETGGEWEKPVSVELLSPDGSPGFQIDAGVRIRGGVYTVPGDNPKHAFKLYFRWQYGAGKLNYPLFGAAGADAFDQIDVKTANDDGWNWNNNARALYIRDSFSRDCQLDMGQPTGRGRFYHLYLNGQYWGLYETEERTDKNYGVAYFGGHEQDYDTIKPISGVFTNEAVDGNTDAYYALWQLAHDTGFSAYSTYMRARGFNTDGTRNESYPVLLDVDNSIVDNLITYYTGDIDGPVSGTTRSNNFLALRNRVGDQGWRFFQHDSELSLQDAAINRTGPYTVGQQFAQFNNQYLHQQLAANAEYKMHFADLAYRYFYNGGALTPEACTARLNARANEVGLAIIAESARWGDAKTTAPYTPANWQAELSWVLNNFIPNRRETVISQFKAKGWYPSTAPPVLSPYGGVVSAGFQLTLSKPVGQGGTIYYTTIGADPRQVGGAVLGTAQQITTTATIIISQNTLVRARIRNNGEWSPLADAAFTTTPVTVRINEFMAENATTIQDPDEPGEYPDWIELYNPGLADVNLGGMYLTDDPANPTQFRIPDGVTIAKGGYAVFWADDDGTQGNHHTNFKLSKAGESVGLYAADGVTQLDLVSFGAQAADVSFGRFPDGTGTWGPCTTPTPGAPNSAHVP